MNEKRKKAAEFLSRYKKIKEEARVIDEQMFTIAALYREIKRNDTPNGEKARRRVDDYEKKLEHDLTELNIRKGALHISAKLIESVVSNLNKNEFEILKRYYLDGDYRRASEDLMEKLGYEKSHIYRLKDKALDKVAAIIETYPDEEIFSEQSGEQT